MSQTTTQTDRPIKRYNDGSTPFTMQEIEERLLKVFTLLPEEINKATVEQAFGVFMPESDVPTYYEEVSEDKKMAITIEVLLPKPSSRLFEYNMFLKKEVNGVERMISRSKDLPDAYKIPYLPFAKKLEERGWKLSGRGYSASHNLFENYFTKSKGYLMSVRIDQYKLENNEVDHSHSKISRIVIETVPKYGE